MTPDRDDRVPAGGRRGPGTSRGPSSPGGPSGTHGGTSTRGLLAGLVLGVPVMAFGARGVLVDAVDTHPAELTRWMVGAATVNDLLLLPVAGAAGWALRRVTPRRAWPFVRAAALTIGVLAVVAWPFVRGYGRDPANPSLLPRNYGLGVLAAMAAVALAATTAALVGGRVRGRGTGPGSVPGR